MPTLRIPALMKFYVDNQTELSLNGSTVSEAIADLIAHYPAIKTHILDSEGRVRRHVNLFVNENNIKTLDGLDTKVTADDKIILLPSISGG